MEARVAVNVMTLALQQVLAALEEEGKWGEHLWTSDNGLRAYGTGDLGGTGEHCTLVVVNPDGSARISYHIVAGCRLDDHAPYVRALLSEERHAAAPAAPLDSDLAALEEKLALPPVATPESPEPPADLAPAWVQTPSSDALTSIEGAFHLED